MPDGHTLGNPIGTLCAPARNVIWNANGEILWINQEPHPKEAQG